MQKQAKFGIGIGVIVISMACLAWLGYGESKTYYHTLAELDGLKGAERNQHMRLGGTVEAGSIHRMTGRVDFVLDEQGRTLQVSYAGRDPLPDTFKEGGQALVEGRMMPDGRFVAEQVQAKCASKYQATPGGAPAMGGDGSGAATSSGTGKT